MRTRRNRAILRQRILRRTAERIKYKSELRERFLEIMEEEIAEGRVTQGEPGNGYIVVHRDDDPDTILFDSRIHEMDGNTWLNMMAMEQARLLQREWEGQG